MENKLLKFKNVSSTEDAENSGENSSFEDAIKLMKEQQNQTLQGSWISTLFGKDRKKLKDRPMLMALLTKAKEKLKQGKQLTPEEQAIIDNEKEIVNTPKDNTKLYLTIGGITLGVIAISVTAYLLLRNKDKK